MAEGFSRGLSAEVEGVLGEALEAFHMYSNAEGMLPVSRLGTVLRAAGQSPTNATVEAIVAQLPDQVISEIQFQDILQQNYKPPYTEEDLLTAFRTFDREGNGMISSSELRDCVMSLSETMSVEEANALLAEIDPEGDGQVDIKVAAGLLATCF